MADAEALLERGQHVALLARLLEQAPILFARAESKDAECCLLVMANIVPRLPRQVRLSLPRAHRVRTLLCTRSQEPQPCGSLLAVGLRCSTRVARLPHALIPNIRAFSRVRDDQLISPGVHPGHRRPWRLRQRCASR